MKVHVAQEALREHEARRLAVDGEEHEEETRQIEVHLTKRGDRRAERDHKHACGDLARGQRLAEEALHHHRHNRCEALEDLDKGDGQVEVRGVARAQRRRHHHANGQYVRPPHLPRHVMS